MIILESFMIGGGMFSEIPGFCIEYLRVTETVCPPTNMFRLLSVKSTLEFNLLFTVSVMCNIGNVEHDGKICSEVVRFGDN